MKRFLFLNLPNKEQITRRYMCSYVSPESLLPPIELISLASIAREKGNYVQLLDCIAENISTKELNTFLNHNSFDFVVSILGLECLEEDCIEISQIKFHRSNLKTIIFGHYATQFPKEVIDKANADFLILGEPDIVFSNLLASLNHEISMESIGGLVVKNLKGVIVQGEDKRIPDPNALPQPAYDLLPFDKYYEPVMPRPFGMIQTARGCPYPCTFCVKSYGSKLTIQSPSRVVDEIEVLIKHQGIRSLRIIDDTFTVNKKRVIEICQEMIQRKFNLTWCCLSRTDNLTEEMLVWMKKSGCTRIYFGLESGSQKILDLYEKRVKVNEAIETLLLCRKVGIETAGFFMSGFPEETEEDFLETIAFAKKAKLTFASINPLTPYPGTTLFTQLEDQLNFQIFPYTNEFKDPSIVTKFTDRKKRFYKAFYMRPSYVFGNIKAIFNNFTEISSLGINLLKYVFFNGRFVISGLKGAKDK